MEALAEMTHLVNGTNRRPDHGVAMMDLPPKVHEPTQKGNGASAGDDAIPQAADAIPPNPAVQFCLRSIDQLRSSGGGLEPKKRWALVFNSLEKLRNDMEVSPVDVTSTATYLHDLAPGEYAMWAASIMNVGAHFILATSPYPPRAVSNLLALLRPRMIAEMKLVDLCAIAQLDRKRHV